MFLRSLSLVNFKNYPKAALTFDRRLTCFVGPNGMGKTNLLDSIYTLCLTRSYFNSVDQYSIRHGEDFYRLDANIEKAGKTHTLKCVYQKGKRKELYKDDLKYEKLSEHVGQFPVVIITPDDNLLINGGSEERRRFMDNLLSQLDTVYLQNLQLYLKILEQRNAYLKRLADNPTMDSSLLAAYDDQLSAPGTYIHQQRSKMAEELIPVFNEIYLALSEGHEEVTISYDSTLHERPLTAALQADRHRDMILKRTNSGIHKDDLDFDMDEHGVKRFGSQGQQKSFLVALKLAQYRLLKEHKGINPILLLDDIFDKLDATRSRNLLQYIMSGSFGQIFITDTQRDRVEKVFEGNNEVAFVEVVEGRVKL